MNAVIRAFLRWLPVVLLAAVIFLLSSLPSKELPKLGSWDVLAKKGAHALGYALLAAFIWRGFGWNRKLWWLAFVLAAAYAATDEFHQRFTPGRHSTIVDVGIDSLGASVSIAFCWLVRRREKSQEAAAK